MDFIMTITLIAMALVAVYWLGKAAEHKQESDYWRAKYQEIKEIHHQFDMTLKK